MQYEVRMWRGNAALHDGNYSHYLSSKMQIIIVSLSTKLYFLYEGPADSHTLFKPLVLVIYRCSTLHHLSTLHVCE